MTIVMDSTYDPSRGSCGRQGSGGRFCVRLFLSKIKALLATLLNEQPVGVENLRCLSHDDSSND